MYCFFFILGCTIVEALEGATLHPAQLLQIEHRKGILNYNSDADLVFVDDHLNVHATFIAGEPVWLKKGGLVTGDVQLKYNLISKKVKKQNWKFKSRLGFKWCWLRWTYDEKSLKISFLSSNDYIHDWKGEVRCYVTMVMEFLDLNNLK